MMNANWTGLRTLYFREVWRFMKVWNQTLIAPMVTTILFLMIFTLALGGQDRVVHGLPFNEFIAPGLIMMSVLQNAFANTSSSFMLQKFQGVIIDLLMPPLNAWEINLGMTMGAVTRGLLVAVSVSIAIYSFVPFSLHSPLYAIAFLFVSSTLMALLGMLTGIWAQSFDQMAGITNYVITPLSFLSGTFYSIDILPGIWHQISLANPFFYMIDGFRLAITGEGDSDPVFGLCYLVSITLILALFVHWLLVKGYRLKT